MKAEVFLKLDRKAALDFLKEVTINSFAERELKNISNENIRSYMKWCKDTLGNDNSTSGAKLSAIKSFYGYLTDENINIISKDATKGIKKPKTTQKLPAYLTEEEAIANMLQEEEERQENLKQTYNNLNTVKSSNTVEVPQFKTMKDLYDELDAESYEDSDRRNINDLIGSKRNKGINSSNLFNSRGRNRESDSFGNNLINNILGKDL
jgi:transcriptional regulator